MSDSLRRVSLVLALESLLVAVIVVAVASPFVPVWLAASFGVLSAAALAIAVVAYAPTIVLRSVCVAPDELPSPRLVNLVEGLGDVFGLPEPTIHMIDDSAPNGLVCGRAPRSANLVVTTGLVEALDRVELEAVVAHLLSRVRTGDLLPDTIAAVAVRPLRIAPKFRSRVLRWILGEHHGLRADLDGVRSTRYPPGLAAALTTLQRDGRVVRCGDLNAQHLWIDEPVTDPTFAVHLSLSERVQALQEL